MIKFFFMFDEKKLFMVQHVELSRNPRKRHKQGLWFFIAVTYCYNKKNINSKLNFWGEIKINKVLPKQEIYGPER